MPKTEYYKDKKGKNRIRHTSDNGNITYASTQGYENIADMELTAINTSLELLQHFKNTGGLTKQHYLKFMRIMGFSAKVGKEDE